MIGFFYQHQDLVDEAVKFIQDNEPPEGYYLGDSGGKDSTIIRHLAILAEVKFQAYYSCTRIDPPDVVKFIKQHHPETIFIFPKETYWHGILTRFPPHPHGRWCCDTLKKDPSKNIGSIYRLLGIRKEESNNRAQRGIIAKYKKCTHYHPIYFWTEHDVWTHIETFNLPYCNLYDEGWSRIGCLCCPFSSYGEHRRNKLRYPGVYKVFEKVVKQKWELHKSLGIPMEDSSAEEYIEKWYRKSSTWFHKNTKLPRVKGFFF